MAASKKPKKGELPERLKKHCFKPGQSGNPGGRTPGVKSAMTLLKEALQREADRRHKNIYSVFVEHAHRNPQVLVACMNKLLPNKQELSFGAADLEDVKAKIVGILARNIEDVKVLERIADELDKELASETAALNESE